MPTISTSPEAAATTLWRAAGLPEAALAHLQLSGPQQVMPSSFAVTAAAQASLGVAALAAAELSHARGVGRARQRIRVDAVDTVMACQAWFALDGRTPEVWDKLAGVYPCGGGRAAGSAQPGWVRIHTNFDHHRDGVLRLLGLPTDGTVEREQVAAALAAWTAEGFEAAATDAGLVVAALRDFATWDAHPQAAVVARSPLVDLQRLDDGAPPRPWPRGPGRGLPGGGSLLDGLRVLDLTRILAGPVGARLLAAWGAEVLMVNAPHLPNIPSIAELSLGKRSALLDLRQPGDADRLRRLVEGSDVFLQAYRPGGLAQQGFSTEALTRGRPGLIVASLSAYGESGPWGQRRGFDSLVQTATGFNAAEAEAFGQTQPRALPFQVLDYCAGHLLAFGILAARWRQAQEGGSWQVRVSLAGVGHWLRSLGRLQPQPGLPRPSLDDHAEQHDSGWGRLSTIRHPVQFADTPVRWHQRSERPGTHEPVWLS